MKARILFVCLGNICRSPMAEAVMRYMVDQAGASSMIEIDSAGTGDWHIGKPPHEGTQKELEQRQISYAGMKARQVTAEDFAAFRYIVCMDNTNLRDVRELLKSADVDGLSGAGGKDQLFTFMELLPNHEIVDVPDPYYTGNFSFVYELIEAGCRELLQRVMADLGQR